LTTEGVRGVSRLTALTNLVIDVGRDVSLEEQLTVGERPHRLRFPNIGGDECVTDEPMRTPLRTLSGLTNSPSCTSTIATT